MKKIFTLSIISFLMLCFYTGKTQTVFTSDFETWTGNIPANWAVGTTVSNLEADSISPYATSVHAGDSACRLVNRQSAHKRFCTQAVSVTAATTYSISFWVRGHGSIRTGLYSGTSYGTYNPYIVVNSTTWAQQTQSITATSTSTTAQFIFSVVSTFADLDDIQIDDVTISIATIDTVSIHDIQYATAAPFASTYNGQAVITGGIVTAKYNKGLYMQDASGPWNGVYVYDSAHIASAGIIPGDSIIIAGTVSEYLTYTELGTITSVTKVSSSNTLHPAYAVTTANSTTEELEGVLVTLTNIPCVDNSGSASYGEWTVYNGTDSTKIGGQLYKYTTATVGTSYDITGVVYLAYGGVVRVEPRNANDVTVHSGINEIEYNNINIYPNPVSNILYINNMKGIEIIKISNILGETIESIKVSGNQTMVNVHDLSKGIYFISLINENGITSTKKFSKE
jgi:hypothetical protein